MKKTAVFICILAIVNIAFADRDDDFDSPDVKVKTKKTEKPAASAKNSKKDETTVKLSGIVETGVDVISRVNRANYEDASEVRSIARGEIGISARPVKNVRAEIGIEYDRSDAEYITIDKFYGQYSISKNSLVRAGIMKKAFGLEERAGLDERYFRSRSIIRSGIKDEGFLNHDLTLQYRRNVGESWRFIGGFSMSESERNRTRKGTDTLRYFQNYSAHYRKGNVDVIGAAVIQHFNYVPEEWHTYAFVSSLSCKHSMSVWDSEIELTFGSSMREEIKKMRGTANDDGNVFIFGVRKKEQVYINTGLKTLRQVIPVAEAAFYWKDLDESKDYDAQIRGGLTLGFAKNNAFQFRNTYGAVFSKVDDDGAILLPAKTKARRYRFDSEVVVIF